MSFVRSPSAWRSQIEAHSTLPLGEALIEAAARASSLGGHNQALAYLEKAIEITSDERRRADLWERAAEAAQNAALFEDARRYLTNAIEWRDSRGEHAPAARATARLGSVLLAMSQVDEAIETLNYAWSSLDDRADAAAVSMAAELARAYMVRGDCALAIDWADTALVGAAPLNLESDIVETLVTKGVAVHDAGRWREGLVLLSGALKLAEDLELVFPRIRALLNLSYVLISDDPRRAGEASTAALNLARKLGSREWEYPALAVVCENAIVLGRWKWAADSLAEVLQTEGADYVEAPFANAYATSALLLAAADATLKALRGSYAEARTRLEMAKSLLADSTSPQDTAQIHHAESWVYFCEGRFEEVKRSAQLMSADPGREYSMRALLIVGRANLWLGNTEGLENSLASLDGLGLRGAWISSAKETLRAGLDALRGDVSGAQERYADAIVRWRQLGCDFDLALCQWEFANMMGPSHKDSLAAGEEALEIFVRLGAVPFLDGPLTRGRG